MEAADKKSLTTIGCLGLAAITSTLTGDLTGSVGSVVALTVTQLLNDLSVNVASDGITSLKFPRLGKAIRKAPDISNHDLQKGFVQSIKTGLQATFDNYRDSLPDDTDEAHFKPIQKKLDRLYGLIDSSLLKEGEIDISDDQVRNFVEGYDPEALNSLGDAIAQHEAFEGHGVNFLELIKSQLGPNITKAFTETLKTDKRVWIAYQRLILADLENTQRDILQEQVKTSEKLDDIKYELDLLQEQISKNEIRFEKTWQRCEMTASRFSEGVLLLEELVKKLDKSMLRMEQRILDSQQVLNQKLDLLLDRKLEVTDYTKNLSTFSPEHLNSYLDFLIREYSTIKLPAIRNDEDVHSMPLDQIYVALYLENERIAQDFHEGGKLVNREIAKRESLEEGDLTEEKIKNIQAEVLQQNQTLKNFDSSLVQGDLEKNIVPLDEVFRQNRSLVMLGDPGSGKSTIVKWLTLQQARTIKRVSIGARVVVDAKKVRVGLEDEPETEIDLGPARIPILIKIPEYAKFFESRRTDNSIIDYLGKHIPALPGVTSEEIQALLSHFINQNKVVVFIDGMDEIVQERTKIIARIEQFLRHNLDIDPSDRSGPYPADSGGNQVLLTSRIVGYHAAPLTSTPPYVYVREMTRPAVESFCRLWCKETANSNPDNLIAAIYSERQIKTRELATNPLLVTILAMLYQLKEGKLPENRVELYEQSIDILSGRWTNLRHAITQGQVNVLLEDLAYHIHASASEVITLTKLSELAEDTIRRNQPELDIISVRDSRRLFIQVIRQEVGLLAEKGTNLYHFLHRTFQEYLAARWLIRDNTTAAGRIIERVSDPVWREPVVLAVAYANRFWSGDRFNRLVTELISTDDDLNDLIPRGLLLISTALPDLDRLSPELFTRLIRAFLSSFGDKSGIGRFDTVRNSMRHIINRIRRSDRKDDFYRGCSTLLKESNYNAEHWALLYLAAEDEWFQDSWIDCVINHLEVDSAEWEFPIDRNLLLYFAKPATQKNLSRKLTFSQFLQRNDEYRKQIEKNQDWLRLVSVMYGGFRYDSRIERYLELQEVIRKVYQRDTEDGDHTYRLAKQLDEELSQISNCFKYDGKKWDPKFFHRPSPFTQQIIYHLHSGKPLLELNAFFEKEWRNETASDDHRAQALLALAALGDNVSARIYAVDQDKNEFRVATRFLDHLLRVRRSSSFVFIHFARIAGSVNGLAGMNWYRQSITQINATQRAANRACVFAGYQTPLSSTLADYNPIFGQELETYTQIPDLLSEREAEFLASILQTASDDRAENLAEMLDFKGRDLIENAQHLLNALCRVGNSEAIKSNYTQGWDVPELFFNPVDEREKLIVAIFLFDALPAKYYHLAEFFFYAFWPLAKKVGGLQIVMLASFIDKRQNGIIQGKFNELKISGNPKVFLYRQHKQVEDPLVRSLLAYFLHRSEPHFHYLKLFNDSLTEVTDTKDKLLAYSLQLTQSIAVHAYLLRITKSINAKEIETLISLQENNQRGAFIIKSIKYLQSPEDIINALLFASLFSSPKLITDNIFDALTIIPDIKEDRIRSRFLEKTLSLFGSEANKFPSEGWKKINDSFTESIYLNQALGKHYSNLIELGSNVAKSEDSSSIIYWEAMTINLMSHELTDRFKRRDIDSVLFSEMEQEEGRKTGLQKFLFEKREGTNLTPRLISLIDKMMEQQAWESLEKISSIVHIETSVDLTMITHWENSSCTIINLLHSLLRAEMGILDRKVIDDLVELHRNYSDRLRFRSAIAVHGPHPVSSNKQRNFLASRLSFDTIWHLYCRYDELSSSAPGISSTLWWFTHNVHYDDPAVINRCCEIILSGSKYEKRIAKLILTSVESVTGEVLYTQFKQLEKAGPEVGQSLLKLLGLQIARDSWPDRRISRTYLNPLKKYFRTDNAAVVFQSFYDEVRSLDIDTVGRIIYETDLNELNFEEKLAKIREILDHAARFPMSTSAINAEYIYEKLYLYGNTIYFQASTFDNHRNKWAERLSDKEDLVRLLIKLTFDAFEEELINPDSPSVYGKHFGGILARLSELRPEFVRNLAPIAVAEELLPKVVLRHLNYVTRLAALELMVKLNILNPAAMSAVANALKDNKHLAGAAHRYLPEYSGQITENTIDRLGQHLSGNSAVVNLEMARLYSRLSRQIALDTKLRKRAVTEISDQLRRLINGNAKSRFLYKYRQQDDAPEYYKNLVYKGELEDYFYEELVTLAGIE